MNGGNRMNELIKTQNSENGEVLVSGRELHEFLESLEFADKKIIELQKKIGVGELNYG